MVYTGIPRSGQTGSNSGTYAYSTYAYNLSGYISPGVSRSSKVTVTCPGNAQITFIGKDVRISLYEFSKSSSKISRTKTYTTKDGTTTSTYSTKYG